MGSPLPIGNILGIYVRVDTTMLLLFVVFGLRGFSAGGVEGALHQLTFLVFLFVSIFLHEYGHALAAGLFGIRTLDVTLHFFGGYARLSQAPRRPLEEGVIAIAGPAVNLTIAGLLYLFLQFITADDARYELFGPYISLIDNLRYANFILGLFNLLPGFPLDGGSVTRAVLSIWLPRSRARLIVAYVGVAVGFGLAAYGLQTANTMTIVLGLMLVYLASMESIAARQSMGPS
jgi:Zn-dependent protease